MKQSEHVQDLHGRLTRGEAITAADLYLLLQLHQITTRLEQGEGFYVANIISHRTGQGMLDVTWMGHLAQIEPVKAREIAWMLLEAASVAETEASLVRFLRETVGLTPDKAVLMLNDFRKHRDAAGASLVGHTPQ